MGGLCHTSERYFRGLDVRWPPASAGQGWRLLEILTIPQFVVSCCRFFNVFHPDDPIAHLWGKHVQ